MEVNAILERLKKAGFSQPKMDGVICSINAEGCFITGTYKGLANIKSKGNAEGYDCHRFVTTKDDNGFAMVGKDAKAPTELKAGEYLVFSTGLTKVLLKPEHVDTQVGLVCDKVEDYETKDAKGKKLVIDSYHHILVTADKK